MTPEPFRPKYQPRLQKGSFLGKPERADWADGTDDVEGGDRGNGAVQERHRRRKKVSEYAGDGHDYVDPRSRQNIEGNDLDIRCPIE